MTADQFRKTIHLMFETAGPEKIIEVMLECMEYPDLLEAVEKYDPDYKRRTDTTVSFSDRPKDEQDLVIAMHQHCR